MFVFLMAETQMLLDKSLKTLSVLELSIKAADDYEADICAQPKLFKVSLWLASL